MVCVRSLYSSGIGFSATHVSIAAKYFFTSAIVFWQMGHVKPPYSLRIANTTNTVQILVAAVAVDRVTTAQEHDTLARRLKVVAANRAVAVQFVLHAYVLVVHRCADARVALGTVIGVNAQSLPMPADVAKRTMVAVKRSLCQTIRI